MTVMFAVKLDSFFGVANLGLKPTFGGVKNLVLEVYGNFLNLKGFFSRISYDETILNL